MTPIEELYVSYAQGVQGAFQLGSCGLLMVTGMWHLQVAITVYGDIVDVLIDTDYSK